MALYLYWPGNLRFNDPMEKKESNYNYTQTGFIGNSLRNEEQIRMTFSNLHSGQTYDACAVPAIILQRKIQTKSGKNVMLAHIQGTNNITILYEYIHQLINAPTSTNTHFPSLVLTFLHTFLHLYSLPFTCTHLPSH